MAYLEKHTKSKAWIVISRINGKKIKKYLGKVDKGVAEAEKALATAREKEAKIGRLPAPEKNKAKAVTLREWLPEFLRWRSKVYASSDETFVRDLKVALDFFGDLPIADDYPTVDRWNAAFNKWETERREEVAVVTLKSEWKNIKAALYRAARTGGKKEGKRWNLSTTSPIAEIVIAASAKDINKKKKIFSPEELEKIYKVNPYHAPIWKFIANTGLRREEARTLPRALVETNADRARVIVSHDPDAGLDVKTGLSRSVPLNREARDARDELMGLPHTGDKFFPEWHRRTWTKHFERDRVAAGIGHGTLHGLRHTFISRAVNNGVPIHLAMKWAGHKKMETTLGYLDTPEGYEWLAMEKMLESEKGKVIELDKMRRAA